MFLLTERLIHAKRFSSVAKVGLELVVIPRPQPASSGITDTSHHICGFASLEADFDVSELCIGSSCFSMYSVWRVHSGTFILKYIKTKSQSIKTGSCFYTCKKHASCIPTNTHPGHCNKREALPLLFIHCKRKGCLDYRDQGTAMVSNPRVLDIVVVDTDCQLEGIYKCSGNWSMRDIQRHRIPWSWSCKWLYAPDGGVGIELGFSARLVYTLNC